MTGKLWNLSEYTDCKTVSNNHEIFYSNLTGYNEKVQKLR